MWSEKQKKNMEKHIKKISLSPSPKTQQKEKKQKIEENIPNKKWEKIKNQNIAQTSKNKISKTISNIFYFFCSFSFVKKCLVIFVFFL